MLRKIKVSKSATEEEILDECKKQASHTFAIQLVGHDSCKLIRGPTVEVVFQTSPPTDTVAVVVDISSAGGAIKIGEASNNNLGVTAVGMVGTEDADSLVIMPWESGWWYYTIGVITVRYIVKV
ncbi:uncharacterized protein N7515_007514 [Penicillium bovifimosum]|uniref:Uncharacterized protein n=1 Tax=Penicillium bovifimosum TaxID=126998 RepID=A0A9W9GWS0_9EURO|nr:uncharacterized protein N7515_007514 [Penicillium bovifimosum]KAJ5131475.1 hypothetical protein N7515_007514 [Penicillium bovifimosum]